ncbi:formin-J-like [Uranotaenia lowii]|uniref:formin-J-like n=1 Tax=Uranotaenia lowii TaxID=190385 RepID=UPI00247A3E76|nr:formin-J-like [Uranotaenia lowii]
MSPSPGDHPGRTIPEWLDPQNLHGHLFYMFLKASDGHTLPNPFLVGRSIEKHVGKIEGAFFDRIRKWYVLKLRNMDQGRKLEEMKKLIDGTPIEIGSHPNLNRRKFVVSCGEVIDMTEADLLAELLSQKITEVRRITKKTPAGIIGTPTLVLTINSTVIPEFVNFGLLRVRTRLYIPQPLLCRQCFSYGHPKKRCPNERACSICSSQKHDSSECPGKKFCRTCQSHEHSPAERTCPKWVEESTALRISAEQNLSLAAARQQIKNNNNIKISYANITRSSKENGTLHRLEKNQQQEQQQPEKQQQKQPQKQQDNTTKQQHPKRDHTTVASGQPAIPPTTPSPPRKKTPSSASPSDSTDKGVGQESNVSTSAAERQTSLKNPTFSPKLHPTSSNPFQPPSFKFKLKKNPGT